MHRSQGQSQGRGGGPCRYCLQDAEFCLDLGQADWAEFYEEQAYDGDCLHAGRSQRREFAILQDYLPPALRLNADPSGRRPCGPSHLTLPHPALNRRTGEPDGPEERPAWPAYRHLYDEPGRSGQTYRRPSSRAPNQHRPSPQGPRHHGPSHHGSSPHGPSRLGPSHHGSSHHGTSYDDGPFSGGAGMQSPGGRSGQQTGSMAHPHDRHRREASDYGSSSQSYSGRDTESESSFDSEGLSSYGSESSRFTGGSQGRSDMSGRRGPY